MLKRTFQIKTQAEQMIDAVIAAGAFTLAIVLRRWLHILRPDVFPMFDALWSHAWLYTLMVPLWVFLLDVSGLYQHRIIRSPSTMFNICVRANIVGTIVTFFVLYVLKIQYVPRMLILLYALADVIGMLLKELLIRRFEPMWTPTMNVLLVGEREGMEEVLGKLRSIPSWMLHIHGLLSPVSTREGNEVQEVEGVPALGGTDKLEEVLHQGLIDCVILSPGRAHFDEVQRIIGICETEGVEIWMMAEFVRTNIARAHVDEFQDVPILVFSTTPALSWALVLKRIIDIAGSLVLIILLSPVMLIIVVAIKLTSPGPVLFAQKRCTLHGRLFQMHKFRTMITEAEALRAELESRNEMEGPVFKIKDDPRITAFGRILRRHSLDELPQLFNVLRGDMSLVGPRPPIPSEVEKYENWQRRRLSMHAGITCLWQVSGRNALTFEDWMKLDLQYIDNWSLGMDMSILLKTPLAMIRGTGY